VNWTILKRRHFPGALLPVKPSMTKFFSGLFAVNERVGVIGEWEHGFFSFTPIGATNVGSIFLSIEPELKTNIREHDKIYKGWGGFFEHEYGEIKMNKGDQMGVFRLGSAILLLFEAPHSFQFLVQPGNTILVGQPVGDSKPLQHLQAA